MTRPEDARAAVAMGADAIGLVFYPPSPRAVTIERAQAILTGIPPFATTVGLFVNERPERVREILQQVPLDLLQFHGDEDAAACRGYGRPWIKAVRMREGVDPQDEQRRFPDAAALLLDAYTPGVRGGTGSRFDWSRIAPEMAGRIILAGGLEPGNVAQAVCSVRPYAVDVSGGVERDKGIKDPHKIAAFMRGVRHGDDSQSEL